MPTVQGEQLSEVGQKQQEEVVGGFEEALATLPEADQSPNPDVPAELMPEDTAGAERLYESTDGVQPEATTPVSEVAPTSAHVLDLNAADKIIPLDANMKANLDASASGDQATKLMKEINPAPGSIGEQVIHEAMQEARENETGVLPSVEVIREEISRREQAAAEAAQTDTQAKEEHVGRIRAGLNKLFGNKEK